MSNIVRKVSVPLAKVRCGIGMIHVCREQFAGSAWRCSLDVIDASIEYPSRRYRWLRVHT